MTAYSAEALRQPWMVSCSFYETVRVVALDMESHIVIRDGDCVAFLSACI